MFRYTKRVWPTVEKKKEEKEKNHFQNFQMDESPSVWASGSRGTTRLLQHPTSTSTPPSVLPYLTPARSTFNTSRKICISQQNNTNIQSKRPSNGRSAGETSSNPQPPNLQTKNLPVKVQTQKNKQKKDSRAAPANHKTPFKALSNPSAGGALGMCGGGVKWAIITFHSSRFNESSHGEHRDALEWSLDEQREERAEVWFYCVGWTQAEEPRPPLIRSRPPEGDHQRLSNLYKPSGHLQCELSKLASDRKEGKKNHKQKNRSTFKHFTHFAF